MKTVAEEYRAAAAPERALLLAARSRGLGGVITTFLARAEPLAAPLIGLPTDYAIAATLFIGHPVHQPTKLRRERVESFTSIDRFDGHAFTRPTARQRADPLSGAVDGAIGD